MCSSFARKLLPHIVTRAVGAIILLSKCMSETQAFVTHLEKAYMCIDHDFLCIWWLLKEPFVLCQDGLSNRQIRTECGLVSSERTPHPWLSQSFSWRAPCMSQHHESRSQERL